MLFRSLAVSTPAAEGFEFALSPGERPRLWIDLVTSVVMEPDPKTYRLVQGGNILFETAKRSEMLEQAEFHLAYAIIAETRRKGISGKARRYAGAAITLACLGAFWLGALSLLSIAIYLDMLKF